MQEKNRKNYTIGLDIGTDSVGWAVVESGNQKIIKKQGKALWGSRLFGEAEPAVNRRLERAARRRYNRRRKRISLLRKEFENEINKVDRNFFQKLTESKYNINDKKNKTIILTKEEKDEIKRYNKEYPTIYHLRKELIENTDKKDIRLVYLAIHHIIKYRGNFLYEGQNFSLNNLNIEEKIYNLFNNIINNYEILDIGEEILDIVNFGKIEELLKKTNISKNDLKIYLKEELKILDNKQFIEEFIKMIIGNQFDLNKMFSIESDSKYQISFVGSNYEDNLSEIEDNFSEYIEIIEQMKEIYDSTFLAKIFAGSKSQNLSTLMIEKYTQHKKDLGILKDILKTNKDLYKKVFKTNSNYTCLYDKYITSDSGKMDYQAFSKELSNILNKIDNESAIKEIKTKLEDGTFLPKITTKDNGKFPYQLNKYELQKIIENQGKYYPFLLDKTNDGSYKLIKLLEFKIPYYVGPLVTSEKSSFAWLEKKNDTEIITPYNFDEVVDKEKTAEKFIKRMISRCTYLLKEEALPNNSLLYSEFKVLNELKQIKVNGKSLTLDQIHDIYNNFFKKTPGSITNKKFIDYLYGVDYFKMYDSFKVEGYSADGKFANNMQSYIDFFGEKGFLTGSNYKEEDADKLIEWITIFEDKSILKSKIKKEYPDIDDNTIERICKKNYSGWGKLSKKLLTNKYYKDKETEVYKSIMDLMVETKKNFMQIINDEEYKFQKMIKEENCIEETSKIDYSVVDELATSPANKRGIYQALLITKAIVDKMGYNPTNIVIEMARSNDYKKRKDTRKEQIIKLYDEKKEQIENYNKLKTELNEAEINSQKLMLYFLQEGKCLYTGASLDINDLSGCEIDHIIPRSIYKDDSIDNKALVLREANQAKLNQLVVPKEYRHESWWRKLKDCNLMSDKKYKNLTRNSFKDEDIKGFINRQIVETRQITKHVANILSNYYKKTNVIYIKASLSHDYREKYELYKFRNINDYHHAHDAYLAAVLGEFKEYYLKYNINTEFLIELNKEIKSKHLENNLNKGFILNALDENINEFLNKKEIFNNRTGELFDSKSFNDKVKETLYRNDIQISRKVEYRTGRFYKETIRKKGEGKIEIKKDMPIDMYGGYTNVESAYFCLIEINGNKKIVGIPKQVAISNKKEEYLKEHLNTNKIKIIKDKIPFDSEVIVNNHHLYLKGYVESNKNCELCNANELKINKNNKIKWNRTLNYILNKDMEKLKDDEIEEINKNIDEIIYFLYAQKENYPKLSNSISKIENALILEKLTTQDKVKIVKEILKIYSCTTGETGNLKDYNLSNALGRINGVNITSGTLITKSILGLKEKKYEF